MASPVGVTGEGRTNRWNEETLKDGGEPHLGFTQNCPMNLPVARWPMFPIPPGLSPSWFLNSPGWISSSQNLYGMSHRVALAQVIAQAAFSQSLMHINAQYQPSSLQPSTKEPLKNQTFIAKETLDQNMPKKSNLVSSEISKSSKVQQPSTCVPVKFVDDGYRWKKYSHKLSRSSRCTRIYYKCLHQNCLVKKKVVHSLDGKDTETSYLGQHNHEKGIRLKREINNWVRGSTKPLKNQNLTQADDGARKNVKNNTEEPLKNQTFLDKETLDQNMHKISNLVSSEISNSSKVQQLSTYVPIKYVGDGYMWKKYGHKVSRSSGCSRIYYKCLHQNCLVKKKVVHSHDGKDTETSYLGEHNHEKGIRLKREINNWVRGSTKPLKDQNLTQAGSILSMESSDGKEMVDDFTRKDVTNNTEEPNPKKRSIEVNGATEPSPSHKKANEERIIGPAPIVLMASAYCFFPSDIGAPGP